MTRDYLAEFGCEPAWDLQRLKQDTIAENRQEKLDRKMARLGIV